MRLYGFWRSSATWRVRIVLAWKELPHTYVPVNLVAREQHEASFAERSPMRQVPVLQLENGVHLAESIAIAEYLEEQFPQRPMLPTNPLLRARVRQIAATVASGIQPFGNTIVRTYVRETLGADDAVWCRHWIARGLGALEGLIAPLAGTHAMGDAVTLADAFLVPQMFHAGRFGVDMTPYPTLRRIEAAAAALPAFAQAHAMNQPDTPPDAASIV